jgi:hypothetical protein
MTRKNKEMKDKMINQHTCKNNGNTPVRNTGKLEHCMRNNEGNFLFLLMWHFWSSPLCYRGEQFWVDVL